MRIQPEILQAYLNKNQITAADLARDIDIAVSEMETLLSGEIVDEPTARAFIDYFGAVAAADMVDWVALGKKNPFSGEVDNERNEGADE